MQSMQVPMQMQLPPNMQAMQNMQNMQNIQHMQNMQQSMQNQQGQRPLPQAQAQAQAQMTMAMTQPIENGSALARFPPLDSNDRAALLHTCIYDYFRRNKQYAVCKAMVDANVAINKADGAQKPSPNQRANGIDDEAKDLPIPNLPPDISQDGSFLMDWWAIFWDLWNATHNMPTASSNAREYSDHVRQISVGNQHSHRQMMNTMTPAHYQHMMRNMQNGAGPNNLKRTAAINNSNPNGGGPMGQMNMNKPMMHAPDMQRQGSGMDLNGARSQSPAQDGASSPHKRQRIEGPNSAGMANFEFSQQGQNLQQQRNIEVYSQNMHRQARMALNNSASVQGMNPGAQGSPMNTAQGLEDQNSMMGGNQPPPRPGPGGQQGNALQDYQMQLMLLEQQNKKRLLMARQENDIGTHIQGPGGPGFPPAMSPQGRPGPSPNPADMKRTPKLVQPGIPGSPMPEVTMQQRGSPAPNMYEHLPPGMPPQFPTQFPHMAGPNMMRPPTSNQFQNNMVTPQQMEAMRQGGHIAGQWRPGMGQPQQPIPMNQRNPMPPPPAPAAEPPRPQEPSPQQTNQAPPTPSQQSKANPKKKATKDTKKPAKGKGQNTGATPAAPGDEPPPTPTPSTPITAHPKNSFPPNGQQNNVNASAPPQQPAANPQQPVMMDNPANFPSLPEDPWMDPMGDGTYQDVDDFNFDTFIETADMDPGLFNFDHEPVPTGEL